MKNYLASVIDTGGTIDRDVDLRVQAAWSSWRKLTGVLYDRKIPLRLKAKVYEAIIRPALAYESECWAMKVNNTSKIATTECRGGITCETKTFDAYYTFHRSTRLCRLRWFGHVQRRDANNVTRTVMDLAISVRPQTTRTPQEDMATTYEGRHDWRGCYPGRGHRPEGVEYKHKATPRR